MTLAITRAVSRSIQDCELTHLQPEPIDWKRAQEQHAEYVRVLQELGCRVVELEEQPDLPDSVFVEDTAIVLDGFAVAMHPGAASRRPEVESVVACLAGFLPVEALHSRNPDATLDGGDVLVIGKRIYVGLSRRSNQAGLDALGEICAPRGYRVSGVKLERCLHLKSAACALDDETLLVNPDWVNPASLGSQRKIETAPGEAFGANVVSVRGSLIYPSSFPNTRARLESAGYSVVTLEASELAKAEGGVTCCSLLIQDSDTPSPRASS